MKVGILTMHRVIHFGSVLQAYALQQTLFKIGIDNEIIDYVYPNYKHKNIPLLKQIISKIKIFIYKCINGNKNTELNKIKYFIYKKLIRSKREYASPLMLKYFCPKYDIYLTGSDQVWNTDYLKGDTSFFFSFIKNKKAKKISYASSFGKFTFTGVKATKWLANLDSYNAISVRETKAAQIIKNIKNIDPEIVLDPTLLLDKNDWIEFAKNCINLEEDKYILVYVLTYAWNPFPYAENLIKHYESELGYKIKVLEPQSLFEKNPNWEYINNISPEEFISLFSNASLVITTSFHGTAFSINLETPFFSIINDTNKDNDDRIKSLLDIVGLNERGIINNSNFPNFTKPDFKDATYKLKKEREKSISFLKTNCII